MDEYTEDYYSEIDEYYDEMNAYYDSLPIRFSVTYYGEIFSGDEDSYNTFKTESYNEAMELYNFVSQYDENAWLDDNYYGVTFSHGEWY